MGKKEIVTYNQKESQSVKLKLWKQQMRILKYYCYYCVQIFKGKHEHDEERNGRYLKEAGRTFRDKNRNDSSRLFT